MIVNWIFIDKDEVIVGATTPERWAWEIEDGRTSGVDAKTLVMARLVDSGPRIALKETEELFVAPSDPERAAALAVMAELLGAAREIHEARPHTGPARSRWFGAKLG